MVNSFTHRFTICSIENLTICAIYAAILKDSSVSTFDDAAHVAYEYLRKNIWINRALHTYRGTRLEPYMLRVCDIIYLYEFLLKLHSLMCQFVTLWLLMTAVFKVHIYHFSFIVIRTNWYCQFNVMIDLKSFHFSYFDLNSLPTHY